MKRKQRNSKRKIKTKCKIPPHSVELPRLQGPKNGSKSLKLNVTRSCDAILPNLKTDRAKGNNNHDIETNVSLPRLAHKQKDVSVSKKEKSDNFNEDNESNTTDFIRLRRPTRLSTDNEEYFSRDLKQKQKCVSDLKKSKGKANNLNKGNTIKAIDLRGSKQSKQPLSYKKEDFSHNQTDQTDQEIYSSRVNLKAISESKTTNRIKTTNQTNHLTSNKKDYNKERVSTIESVKNHLIHRKSSKSCASESENREYELTHRDSGIFESSCNFGLTKINQSQSKGENQESIKKASSKIAHKAVNVELLESGLKQSKESGASESTMNSDEGFCEQDLIFEEVTDVTSVYPQNHRQKTISKTLTRSKARTKKLPNMKNLESGLHCNRYRGNLLSTTEFKVQGLEIGLREFPLRKKPRNASLAARKPRVFTRKGIKDDYIIQGCKVKGSSVDVDEYVIAMVRLVNCNDSIKQDDMRGFPLRLFEGFS